MSTGEVIDANADRFFEAVVQADVENGNFTTITCRSQQKVLLVKRTV